MSSSEAPPVAPEARVWPFVGRELELERIGRTRSEGDGRGVVITAPAGVGKSRLGRVAVAAAEETGASTAWVHATRSAAAVPMGAFAPLLPGDVRSDDPLELMRRSADVLHERAGGAQLVVGVDDAQLLDPTSAALVLSLAENGVAFVIATVRAGEPCPDAVQSLWKDAGAHRLDLEPLSEAATGQLVEAVLQGPVEERARIWVYEQSRGNALYIRELVLGALAAGSLEERNGFWRLGADRPPPTRSLVELVEARLTDLSADERSALELLALGEPLRFSEVTELVGADALAAVEKRGLVQLDGTTADASVRAAHPVYADVVRAAMPVTRAHAARVRLAAVVGARKNRSSDDPLRIAHWLLDAGEPVPLELSIDAADAAILSGAVALGATFATRALAEGGGARASILLARTHAIYKRHDEAESVLAGIELEIPKQELETAWDYLEQRALLLFWGVQQPDAALELVRRADGWWPDPAWHRRLQPLRVYLEWLTDDSPSAAISEIESLRDDPELEPASRRSLDIVLAASLFYDGRAKEASELAVRVRPTVPLRGPGEEITYDLCCTIAGEAGEDLPGLVEWIIRTIEQGVRVDDHATVGIAAFNLAEQRTCEGRYREAARLLAESITQFERRDPFGYLAMAHGFQIGVNYYLGDLAAAEAEIDCYRSSLGDHKIYASQKPYYARIEATALLVKGDAMAAQQLLIEEAERCDDTMPHYGIELRHHALRSGAPAGPLSSAVAQLAPRCDACLTAAYVNHIARVAARDGKALLDVTDEFAEIGMIRFAAEAAAHAAEAFADEGRDDSARRAAARCRELHALGDGGWIPPIRGIDLDRTLLSSREAQLVDLAARGLTNAEIADRLVLSVRTVESHIYRAMQKLGVNDRRDLPKRMSS